MSTWAIIGIVAGALIALGVLSCLQRIADAVEGIRSALELANLQRNRGERTADVVPLRHE